MPSRTDGWSRVVGDTRFDLLRLHPPFGRHIDEPGRESLYFVLAGTVFLDCNAPEAHRLDAGAAAAVRGPHQLRHAAARGTARPLGPADTAPFQAPPEAGAVEIYRAAAPGRSGIQPQPGPAVMTIPPGTSTSDNLGLLVALARGELAQAAPDTNLAMRRVGELMGVQLMRFYRSQAGGRAALLRGPIEHDERLMRSVLRYFDEPARRWSVGDLAAAAGMSRSAFAQRFQSVMGESPAAYLVRLRLQEAAAGLAAGGRSLLEIAAAAGYRSETSFSRAFRRQFGAPPGAWRAANADLEPRGPAP